MMNLIPPEIHQRNRQGEQTGGEPLPARDKSEVEELISLRLQVKNPEDLTTYRGELMNQGGEREQLLHEQLGAQPEEPDSSNPGPERRVLACGAALAELVAVEEERRSPIVKSINNRDRGIAEPSLIFPWHRPGRAFEDCSPLPT